MKILLFKNRVKIKLTTINLFINCTLSNENISKERKTSFFEQ